MKEYCTCLIVSFGLLLMASYFTALSALFQGPTSISYRMAHLLLGAN